jgi:trk system potassium uptake protein TrkH
MMNWYNIAYLVGLSMLMFCCFLCLAFGASYIWQMNEWMPFLQSLLCIGFPALSIVALTHSSDRLVFHAKDAFLVTVLLWVAVCVSGSLPFYLACPEYQWVDALFDSVSALTTTGCSLKVPTQQYSIVILLWRSLLQWLGGVGIIMMVLIFLPTMQLGGSQLFRVEFSDHSDRILPQLSKVIHSILKIYSIATLIGVFALKVGGTMSWTESWLNAASAISTTGLFHQLPHQNPWILFVLSILMLVGGCSFLIFVKWWHRGFPAIRQDPQLRLYGGLFLIGWCFVTGGSFLQQPKAETWACLSHGMAMSASFLTTTAHPFPGQVWHPLAVGFLTIVACIGGCVGSTSGGIKIYRVHVLIDIVRSHLQTLLKPNAYSAVLHSQRMQNNTVAVLTSCVLFLGTWMMLSLLLMANGLSTSHGFLAAMMCIGNCGDGFMQLNGHTFDYIQLSAVSKFLLMVGMMVGRLELLSMVILLHPAFWRR